jgi:hypothetical protein
MMQEQIMFQGIRVIVINLLALRQGQMIQIMIIGILGNQPY